LPKDRCMHKKSQAISKILGSKEALLVFIAVFIVLAAHIALTKTFPLPYDESFHFGLIKLYTHHLNPFLASQPAGGNAFGAVARNPSYLYHYLMSFPLRLISLFTLVTIKQVVALRVIDICFGVISLVLLKKLATRFGASAAMANLAVLALAITPVFYDVSGQINYDNLLIPLTLFTVIWTVDLIKAIRQGRVSFSRLGLLLTLLLLTSLVKFAFLPIMAVIGIYVTALLLMQSLRRHHLKWAVKWKSWATVLTVVGVLISGALWVQRYGVNLVEYHTPVPQCNAVLSISACSNYAPWYRNYELHQTYAQHPIKGLELGTFTRVWLRSMYDDVYSIAYKQANIVVFKPIRGIVIAADFILVSALLYGVIQWRRAKGTNIPWLFLGLVIFGYVLALWGRNFSDFHNLGALIGVQGRYMLLILPIIYALSARMYTLLTQQLHSAHLSVMITRFSITGKTRNRKSTGLLRKL
jgi:hypothetical protein